MINYNNSDILEHYQNEVQKIAKMLIHKDFKDLEELKNKLEIEFEDILDALRFDIEND